MLLTERCLMCDVEDGDRTLCSICKACSAAGEQLLGPVLQDI